MAAVPFHPGWSLKPSWPVWILHQSGSNPLLSELPTREALLYEWYT